MHLLEIIKNRRSIRKFRDEKISETVIEKLKESLIWAPLAGNLQSRKFYFVFSREIKEKLAEAAFDQDFIVKAPLIVVGCADLKIEKRYDKRGRNLYSICDVSASIENMLLFAYSEGLGSCWLGAFDEKKVFKILNLPENLRPIVIVPIGFPSESPSIPPRISKEKAIKVIE